MSRPLLLLLLLGLLATPSATRATTLKIATVMPDGSAWVQEMRQVAARVEEETEGRVRLKFYPGGVMGNDKTVLRKIRAGQLHGGALTSGGFEEAYPDLSLYGLPLLFRSYDEVDYVRERVDPAMIAGIEEAGFVPLAISDGGFAYLFSQKPARSLSDLAGAKVWIKEGDVMSLTAFEVAGVSPVQLPLADVYTALQTGLIDTVAAPAMGAIALQWHTKAKYVTDVPLTYLTGVLVIDGRAFGRIRPEDQKVLRETVEAAARRLDDATRRGEEDARQALRDHGIQFVSAATPEEVARWHRIADESLAILRRKQIFSDAMIDAILGHLERFRSAPRPDRDE